MAVRIAERQDWPMGNGYGLPNNEARIQALNIVVNPFFVPIKCDFLRNFTILMDKSKLVNLLYYIVINCAAGDYNMWFRGFKSLSLRHLYEARALDTQGLGLFRYVSFFGMIRTSDTIMFLLKDRNATYYARYCFSKDLVTLGFPSELRFSLSTKKRSEAIDRLMVIMSHIRSYIAACDIHGNTQLIVKNLRSELRAIRQNSFAPVSYTSPVPAKPALPAKDKKTAVNPLLNEQLIGDFVQSKQAEDILPRTVQQLESRIRAFVKFSQTNILSATTRQAMEFRDELLKSGKSEKSVIEYLAAVRQFYKWLRLRGDLDKNIFEGVAVKRKSRKASEERQRWTQTELARLFAYSADRDR